MKFTVTGSTAFTVQVNWTREVKVTKAQVVEELSLEGEDKAEWKDSVREYLESVELTEWAGELENCIQVDWDQSNGDIEGFDFNEVETTQDNAEIEDVEWPE